MPADLKIYIIILQLSCKPAVCFEVSLPPFCFCYFLLLCTVWQIKKNDEDYTSEHSE